MHGWDQGVGHGLVPTKMHMHDRPISSRKTKYRACTRTQYARMSGQSKKKASVDMGWCLAICMHICVYWKKKTSVHCPWYMHASHAIPKIWDHHSYFSFFHSASPRSHILDACVTPLDRVCASPGRRPGIQSPRTCAPTKAAVTLQWREKTHLAVN